MQMMILPFYKNLLNIQAKKEALADPSIIADVEMAVDLSKSSRVNVIVQNTCSKPVLSNGVPLKLSHEKKKLNDVIAINSTSIETVKKSESSEDKASKMSTDFKHQLHEAEANKFHKKSQIFSDRYESSSSTNSGSGFSHLQALQNMCESNAMGGIPKILSTNRHNADSNKTVISESKTVTNSNINFETISEKYNYNEVHCLKDKIHGADCETTDILLKSNVHEADENKDKKELENVLQVRSNSSDFKASMKKQENINRNSEVLPTDLSYPTSNKSKKSEVESNLSENVSKTDSSSVNEKNSALRNLSSDIKETLKLDEGIHSDKKKDELNVTKISSVNEREINLREEKVSTSCNSSQNKTLSKTSVEDKNINKSSDEEDYLKEQISVNSLKNAAESSEIGNYKNEHCKLPTLKNLHEEEPSATLLSEKDVFKDELMNDQVKNSKVACCNVSDSSDKPQSEPLKDPNSDTSNSVIKESETEILTDKKEVSKSTDYVLQESKNRLLKVLTDPVCSSSFKSNLILPKNDLAVDFSFVNPVSTDTEDKASLDIVAVDIVDKIQKSVMKLKPTDFSIADGKKSSCENDANKNMPSDLYVSEECSATNNETILSEKTKSNELTKNDTKEKLSELKGKCDDPVSNEKNCHVIDSSQASELVSRDDKEFETRIDVKTTEQKCLKTVECDVNKLDVDYSKLIQMNKELLYIDKDTVSEKNNCSKFNKVTEREKYLSCEKDSAIKKKDCIANYKKGEKREKAFKNDDIVSEKKDCEEKPEKIEVKAVSSDDSVLEEDCKEKSKKNEESGKSFSCEDGSILEESIEIEVSEKTLNSYESSIIKESKKDCKEIEKCEKTFNNEEKFQTVESEDDINSERENVSEKATSDEKSKKIEIEKHPNEKDNLLEKKDLNSPPQKIEVGEGLNNEKDNIVEKRDLKDKPKEIEIEKGHDSEKDNIKVKNDFKEKTIKNEIEEVLNNEKDNIKEKKDFKEKTKQKEIEEGLNNEKEYILEKKDLKEPPKKIETEKGLNNEKEYILDKNLKEKQNKIEIEKGLNNEKGNVLEKRDLNEKSKKIEESEHFKKDVNSVLEKKASNDKSKKYDTSMKKSKFLETEKDFNKKDNDICSSKTDSKSISESVLFQKRDKSLGENKCNSRNAKNSKDDDLENQLTVLHLKEKEDSKEDLSIPSNEESASSSKEKELNKCNKSKIISKSILLREQFNVYNLRHITCLEAKFKHPSCDKYIRKSVDPKLIAAECPVEIEIEYDSCSNEVSTTKIKKRGREKNVKQLADKKSQLNAKTIAPAKKIPVSIEKKMPSRSRKKVNDDEKLDFSIPEGFLEILGNAEKSASETGTIGKKRKGFESKEAPGSHQSSENESTPIKRSRRIQEQHQKKMTELAVEMEREQRMLEQMAKCSNSVKKNKTTSQKSPVKLNIKRSNTKLTNIPVKSLKTKTKIPEPEAEEDTCMESRRATRKMNSRSKNLTKMTLLYEDESKDSEFSTSRETEKSKKRRRGRGLKKGFKPWDVSSESSSSVEELTEEEEEEEEPEEILIFDVNEDEFACEEVDPNAEPVIIRRARTAKKTEVQNTAEECINDDTPCKKCGKYDKPDWILLCDKCDSGYHTHCLIPPLMLVPDGDWFCQPCEHMSLCQFLHEELNKLEVILKQKEREELRKQRLAYVGISLDNVLKPEKKEKSDESSKEEEEVEEEEETENELENQKPQKPKKSFEDERHQKIFGKRSVRARRTVNYQFKEYDELIFSALQEDMIEVPEEFKEDGSEAESDKPFTAKISKKKKRSRRFKDFDSDDEDSGEEYQGGSTDSEATAPPSSHSDQESGSGEWKVVKSRKKPQRKSRSRRKGGDSSEEDWDDEELDDTYRPTTRRAAQKAISYREISSEEEDEWGTAKPRVPQKRRKASSSESEASFKRKTSTKKRIRKWACSDSSEEEKSMSSSGESEEEEEDESQEEGSGNEFEIDRKDNPRLKSNANKKVLSTDEEESSTQDSAPKKKTKKIVSDESDDEEEEEESDDEENSEDDDDDDDDDEEEEEKTEMKTAVPEKKASPLNQNLSVNNSESNTEKKGIPYEKLVSGTEKQTVSINKETSLSSKENKEFQSKVLVKKELCSVDIPLEPMKQPVMFSAANEKAPPKIVRKDTTKMVPCVIPYEKSPKSVSSSKFEEESEKEVLRRVEEMPHPNTPSRPMSFPKQGVPFMSPSSRIQFGGVLARHSVPPLTPSARPSVHTSNMPSQFTAPTNLSTRPPTPSSVVVRHNMPLSRLPVRSTVPVTNIPVVPSAPQLTAPLAQTTQNKSENKQDKSTIMEPFSNMDDENDTDDEVPLERIPTACVPASLPNRPVSYEKETEYRPAAKDLPSYSYAPPEEKPYPGSYSSLGSFQDYSTRPSPLKPSLVETYPNNSSPSKLTPLDTYSQTSSPKGFISLDSYSENRKKKHFYGNTSQEPEPPHRPLPPSSENYQGGEIRFPPEPYPCPQSPNTFSHRSPPPNQRDPGTPPRLYSQFPDAYAPPRSPEYYQNHQYYASEERIARPSYQPNYAPQEPSFISNPYVATPVPQPNGGFMIDTLLRARNHEEGEDELTGVTDIVSYITQE